MVSGFGRPMQLLIDKVDRFQGLTLCMCDGFSTHRQLGYECGCCEVIVFRVCSSSHDFRILCVWRHRNTDLLDKILYCLLMAMAKVQSVYRKASFLFALDVNAHPEGWLGSSTMYLHGRVARDFASSSGCNQMVVRPTHIDGGVLDLVLTDIPDRAEFRDGLPVTPSDHSAVLKDVVLVQPIPYLVCI